MDVCGWTLVNWRDICGWLWTKRRISCMRVDDNLNNLYYTYVSFMYMRLGVQVFLLISTRFQP